jgi:RimJ/RimL family protein N-acetyltransferase
MPDNNASSVVLETKRLRLRQPVPEDVPAMTKHLSNPLISNTTLTIPYPYHSTDAETWVNNVLREWAEGTGSTFGIILKKTNEYIGAMGLHANVQHNRAEAGYWIAEPFWNQGYASEALTSVLKFGFESIGYQKIFATHMLGNEASGRVMMNAGMIHEGVLKDHYKKGDRYITVVQYRLTKEEYLFAVRNARTT